MSAAHLFIYTGSGTSIDVASFAHGLRVQGAWTEVDRILDGTEWAEEEFAAELLSQTLKVVVVYAVLQPSSDTIWIRGYRSGGVSRELLYTGDNGWVTNRGDALPDEDVAAIERLRQKRGLSASLDGYELLDALMSRSGPENVEEGLSPTLPERLPAFGSGYFQGLLTLPSGDVLAGESRVSFGWLSTYLIKEDGKPGLARDIDGKMISGVPKGVTEEDLVVLLDGGYGRPSMVRLRQTPEGLERVSGDKKLALKSVVGIVHGQLFVVEKNVIRRLNSKGRAVWKTTLDHDVARIEAAGPHVCAEGRDQSTFLQLDDGVATKAVTEEPPEPSPLEYVGPHGSARFTKNQLHWTAASGETQTFELPNVTAVGPLVGDQLFVQTRLGLWGACWWSFRLPPTAGNPHTLRRAIEVLNPKLRRRS